MIKLFILLILTLPLNAAVINAQATSPEASVQGLFDVLEVWIQDQRNDDGSPEFPQLTEALRRKAFLDTLFRTELRRILVQACADFPSSCPSGVQGKRSAQSQANADLVNEVELLVQ